MLPTLALVPHTLTKHLKPWLNRGLALGLLATSLVLVGCNDDEDDDELASLRVIHASPDAPPVNVSLSGLTVIEDLDYGESSGFLTVPAAVYSVAVEGIIPGGNQTVISVPGFALPEGAFPTIVAVDTVANIAPLVVQPSSANPTASQVSLVATHAAPVAGEVDVFLTAPGAAIAGESPAFSFDFQESVDAGALTAGEVEIQVALGGSLVYNSGPVDLSAFAGQKLLVLAVNTVTETEQAAAPVKLLVATTTAIVELLDADTQAGARIVHASPDAPSVEVFATSSALGMTPVELVDSIAYPDVVPTADGFVGAPAGDYVFDVAPDTDTIGDSVFTSDSLALAAGAEYSVIAAGRLLTDPPFRLLVTADNNRQIATQASLKVIHAAPAAGDVDIYVTAAGEFSAADVEAGLAGDPLLADFAFATITDYVPVAPASYDIRVVAGGVTAINLEGVVLNGGDVINVIARGPAEPAGLPDDFGVILLTP